jgi:hypothetical protein
MGVMTSGWCHITQVCHKILVALLTMVLRIGDMKFDRTSRDQIANIMQLAVVHMLASRGLPARRARTVGLIAVFFDHLCFGQIFDLLIFDIRLVLARTVFFRWLFGKGGRFHPASLLQNASFGHSVVGRLATVSNLSLFLKSHPIFGGYAVVCSDIGRNLYPYTRYVPRWATLFADLNPKMWHLGANN